ncbi:MAG: hypothetical protein IJU01_07685 [Lachnospiraceae bacterium]|nr:hypothetical protein [Lachnospiraceae bacterium]
MKGTEKILSHIRTDADAQAAAIMEKARAEAGVIKADYDKKAQEAYDEAMSRAHAENDARIESMQRMSQMEAKKQTLALKQDMVSEVFQKALEMLSNLPADEYEEFLIRTAKAAGAFGDEEIILNEKDRAAYGEKLIAALNKDGSGFRLSEATGAFSGGLIIKRGNIETNCTAELLLESRRSELSAEVVRILFG